MKKIWWWAEIMKHNILNSEITVAAIQFNPKQGSLDDNRSRMADLLAEAAGNGAKVIVFPEMAASGYVWDSREEISPYVETIPGPTTDALLAVTSRNDCYAVVGLPEIDPANGAYYNSAALVGPSGVIGVYRKTHLFASDPRWAREGNEEFRVFKTPIGNIAILICMDAMYFEPTRIAALQEADMIAFPTNWVGGGNNPPSKTWCLRAAESGLYWIAANRSDQERGAQFTGGSGIIGPAGDVQDMLVSGEGIIYGKVVPDANHRRRILESRRPHAYQELLLQPYLWHEGETRSIDAPVSFDIVIVPYLEGESSAYKRRLKASFQNIESLQKREGHRIYVLPEFEIVPQPGTREQMLHVLRELAVENDGYLVITLVEHDDVKGSKQVVYLIGPEGIAQQAVSVHSKLESREQDFEPAFRNFKLPFGRIGILTGEDASYPESYRVLAKQGADVIAVSSNGTEAGKAWMRRIWAFENDAVTAVAAPLESEENLLFLHRQAHQEGDMRNGAFTHTFEPEQMAGVRRRPFIRRLKTHLYDPLIQS
jgi:predicted amidohydrolase